MKDITDKADSTAGATGQLPADEYNDHKNEIQKAVEKTLQTLSAGITDQFSQALFINGAGAQTVIDAGSANSVLLSPITGASGLVVPDAYALLSGAILEFDKGTPNTSTSVTVNFGQTGTELGAKNLKKFDGETLEIGEVKGRCIIIYNLANDEYRLLSTNSGEEIIADQDISAGSQVTGLATFEAGGGTEKPDGFILKSTWSGGNSAFNHSYTTSGYTIGNRLSGFIAASLWIGHGQGELLLELDKVNSRWNVLSTGIWDTGSDSNGTWSKHADKTMEQFSVQLGGVAVTTAQSPLFKSTTITWTFAIPFFIAPNCSGQAYKSGLDIIGLWSGLPSTTLWAVTIWRTASAAAVDHFVKLKAKGTWA